MDHDNHDTCVSTYFGTGSRIEDPLCVRQRTFRLNTGLDNVPGSSLLTTKSRSEQECYTHTLWDGPFFSLSCTRTHTWVKGRVRVLSRPPYFQLLTRVLVGVGGGGSGPLLPQPTRTHVNRSTTVHKPDLLGPLRSVPDSV